MDVQFYVNLNNEYDFKRYCAQKSIEVFEHAIDEAQAPSRFKLLELLTSDFFFAPLYLLKRSIIDVAVNIFNLLNAEKEQSMHLRNILDITGLIIIQTLLPVVCIGIRISATIMGFFSAHRAVEGWKLAESGDYLSYSLWSNFLQDSSCQSYEKQAYEEIYPSNAIFYLGESYTRSCLNSQDDNHADLETKINEYFLSLLKTLAIEDPECCWKLIDYQAAQDSKIGLRQNGSHYYYLNYSVKEILFKIQPLLSTPNEDPDQYIEAICSELSLEETLVLFKHIHLNLSYAFFKKELDLNEGWFKSHFTLLKDLFCQRFDFGRAHFYQPLFSSGLYSQT